MIRMLIFLIGYLGGLAGLNFFIIQPLITEIEDPTAIAILTVTIVVIFTIVWGISMRSPKS